MVKRFLIVFLPLSFLLAGILAYLYILETRSVRISFETKESANRELQFKTITNTLTHIVADLAILSELHELIDMIENQEKYSREELASDFISFSRRKGLYDQIRFLDETGMEIIRVNYNSGNPVMVPDEYLQLKENRYYFKETIKLEQGEIFISPLDLNIEKGKIERPLKPVLRFGTPVIDSQGRKRGVMIVNFLGALLIESFKAVSIVTSGHDLLINSDGYWLIGYTPEEEWGFMFKDRKDKTFQNSFPDVWGKISREESGQFITSNGLYTFTTLYPLLEIMNTAAGSRKLSMGKAGISGARNYYWKIISHIPPDILNQKARNLMRILQQFYAVMILLFGTISWVLARNSTKRKQAEKVLVDTKIQLSAVLDTAGEGIIAIDSANIIVMVNYEVQSIWGYEQEELIGKNLQGLMPEKYWEAHSSGLKRYLQTGIAQVLGQRVELEGLKKDGTVFPLEIKITETKIGERMLFTAAVRDITKQKRAEEEMKELNRSLEKYAGEMEHLAKERAQQLIHADRMATLGIMSAGVAHEINNPTTFIRVNASTLKTFWNKYMKSAIEKAAEENGDFKEKLNFILQEMPKIIDEIENGTCRIKKIVDSLRDFSRKEESSFASTSICECIEDALKLSKFNTILKNRAVIELNLPENIPNVFLDKQEIEQVLINLFVNASQAMEEIKDGRKPILKISAALMGNEVVIKVTDNGCGVDKKSLHNIFNPFFTTKAVGKGTGLGLSICYGIIEKHRGAIKATSTPGEGTTFTITLPVDPKKKERRKKEEKIEGGLRNGDG